MEAASLKSPPIVVLSSGCGRVCLTVEEFMGALYMSGAEVFQYIDGDTFVHKLNPLVKMLFSVFVIVAGVING